MTKQFTRLISQNFGIMHAVLNKYFDSEDTKKDVLHDIIIEAWQSYPSFRGECKFSTWLHKIASRKCYQYKACEAVRKRNEVEFARRQVFEENIGSWDRMINGLRRIKSSDRILLLQYYVYRIPSKLIAARLGITPRSLRARVCRIKERVKTIN